MCTNLECRLSETEKQLKNTKNQSTWITVALLQFIMTDCLEPLDDTADSDMITYSQTGNHYFLPYVDASLLSKKYFLLIHDTSYPTSVSTLNVERHMFEYIVPIHT
jgi:hypothetical protein